MTRIIGEIIKCEKVTLAQGECYKLTLRDILSKRESKKFFPVNAESFRRFRDCEGKALEELDDGTCLPVRVPTKITEQTVLGVIESLKDEDVTTSSFKIKVTKQFERFVEELSFIRTVFQGDEYFGQITREWRGRDQVVHGQVEISGSHPQIPFKRQENVYPVSSEQIVKLMRFDPDGYKIGKIINSDINVTLSAGEGEDNAFADGATAFGAKNSGKTVCARILCEERLKKNEVVFIVDNLGDYILSVPADSTDLKQEIIDKMKKHGVEPRAFKAVYLSANRTKNPFTNVEFGDFNVFKLKKFYQTFLQKGVATVVQLKGLDSGEKTEIVSHIAHALKKFGHEGWLPQTFFVLDEAHKLAQQLGSSDAKKALIDLIKEGGHINLNPYFLTQRSASLSKDVSDPQNAYVFHNLSSKNDLLNLPPPMKPYRHLIARLETGQALIYGLTRATLPIDIRPPHSMHFRLSKKIFQQADEHPELCETNRELQNAIDSMELMK